MSKAGVRSVTAVKMKDYHDLSEFEHGVIVRAREVGISIYEVAMCWGFFRTTISRVHREYRESGKTSNLRPENILQERDQRRLKRIVQRDRCANLPQISAVLTAGPSKSVSVRTI